MLYSNLYECKLCKVQFLSPQPNDLRLAEIYSRDYYTSWGVNENAFEVTREMKYRAGQRYLKKIKKYKSQGTLLDVGCAFGFFLEAARDNGFETYGIEFSAHSATHAKGVFGNHLIHCGTIEDNPFNGQKFDVITMFDLIEHTRMPNTSFQSAVARLNHDGLIVLTTPDTGSWTNKLLRKRWIHYKEEHLFYFNLQSLNRLAVNAGMQIIDVRPCKKTFNLHYVFTQFAIYKFPVISTFFMVLARIIPQRWQQKTFGFAIGELLVIMRKRQTT